MRIIHNNEHYDAEDLFHLLKKVGDNSAKSYNEGIKVGKVLGRYEVMKMFMEVVQSAGADRLKMINGILKKLKEDIL